MNTSIQIVYPQSSDIEPIINLYEITWLHTYPNPEHGITLADLKAKQNAKPRSEKLAALEKFLQENEDNPQQFYRVAKFADKVIGVCGGREEDDFVHMASLYVLPEEQRRGVGSRLMQSFMDWAKAKSKPIRLHVVTYNQSAITFYEKWGFKDNGKRFTEERYKMKSGNYFPEMEMVWNSEAARGLEHFSDT